MPTAGIIAEYNPFHNGHLHHLRETKKLLPDCRIICVMSGHFLQRGEPSILNKWARAEMAVAQGADLILELPVLYSCRSAYWFARGGLEILAASGVTSHLSFGVETENLTALEDAARLLAEESEGFIKVLRQGLQEGLSYPRARSLALEKALAHPGGEILNKPNNILALAYLRVIKELDLPLIPLPVIRKGAGYNETRLDAGENPSATAIRKMLANYSPDQYCRGLAVLKPYLPESSLSIMEHEAQEGRCPVCFESLTPQVLTLLRRSALQDLKGLIEVREGLESRLKQAATASGTLAELLRRVKTKRYTYTRLQRLLCHLLLNYTKEKEAALSGGPPYLRVLAFNKKGQSLLKEIKAKTSVPVINKATYGKRLAKADPRFEVFWEMDILASDLYSILYPSEAARKGGADYLISPVNLADPKKLILP